MGITHGPLFNDEYSMSFDGTDDYVDCGNILDKNKSTPFSISFWVNIPTSISNNRIITKIEDRDAGGPLVYGFVGYQFYFNNFLYFSFALDTHFSHTMYVRDGNYWGSSQGLLGGWHHIVGTYDGSGSETGMTLYVDGYDVSAFRYNNGTPSSDFNNSGSLYIGGMNYNDTPYASFGGKLDEPCIIPIELTAAQVLTIYNGIRPSSNGNPVPSWVSYPSWNDGTGRPAILTSFNPNGWWRMGDNGVFKDPQWLLPENSNKDNASNYSMSFDGSDDYIGISTMNLGTRFSTSMWLKTTQSALSNGTLISAAWGGGFSFLMLRNNQVFMYRGAGSEYSYSWPMSSMPIPINDGNWHNLVVIRDVDTVTFYIDGVDWTYGNVGTGTADFNFATIGDGPSWGTAVPYEGDMDELAVWGSLLTPADVNTIFNSGRPADLSSLNPIGWWRMGENATYKYPQWLIPENSNKDKASNYSLSFDGTNDYVATTTGSTIGIGNKFSMSAWVNADVLVNYDCVCGNATALSLNDGYGFYHFVDKWRFFVGAWNSTFIESSINAVTGSWFHLVGVYDNSLGSDNMEFFVNGVSQGTANKTSALVVSGIFDIGRVQNNSYNLNGKIGEVSLWDVKLTQSQVTSIYNSGEPTDLSAESNLVGYWKLGEMAYSGATGDIWVIPDSSTNSNTGLADNMTIEDRVGDAPNSINNGLSSNMTIEDRIGNAPSSSGNTISYNMELNDRITDVPI